MATLLEGLLLSEVLVAFREERRKAVRLAMQIKAQSSGGQLSVLGANAHLTVATSIRAKVRALAPETFPGVEEEAQKQLCDPSFSYAAEHASLVKEVEGLVSAMDQYLISTGVKDRQFSPTETAALRDAIDAPK